MSNNNKRVTLQPKSFCYSFNGAVSPCFIAGLWEFLETLKVLLPHCFRNAWCTKAHLYRNALASYFLLFLAAIGNDLPANQSFLCSLVKYVTAPCRPSQAPVQAQPHPSFPISIRIVLLSPLSLFPSITTVGSSVGSSFRAPNDFVVGPLYRWDRASWGAPPVNKAHFTSLSGQIPEHQDGHDFLRSYGSCLEFFGERQPQNIHLFCQSITRELFSLTSIMVVPTAP